ncbi:MAG: autotransporter, partial [Thermoanaerobaculia bacterium]
MRLLFRAIGLSVLFAALTAVPGGALAQDPAPADVGTADAYTGDPQWPRVIEDGGLTLSVYQPQIDRFEDNDFEARAAVQVETPVGEKTQTTYGVIWIQAHPFVDKEARLVQLDDIQITKASFPTAGDKADQYLEILRRNAEPTRTISLERIEANLAITQADKKGNAVPLKNDPPKIYYRTSPALLLLIDGDPVLRPVEGSDLQRVVNTRSLILQDGGAYAMPIGDRWLTARSATGPWQLAAGVSPAVQAARDAIAKDENQTQVDLIEDPGEDVQALLERGSVPEIIVSTVPAELLVTRGKPEMKPISGTQLLYVSNTSGDILLDLKDQSYYVPLTGRWFRAKSLEGPWQFVDGAALPADFAKIPANDPKSSVLATVPGTPAAQEAVIANSIPQTAEVNREEAKFESRYDGDPRFDDVPDTPLQYAVNSPTPVVRVSATSYYAVQSGVWFTGDSPYGPWFVATAVPPVIYTIPTASSIHYVTYVRVYRYDPTYVWVGYTPGYLGTCYSPWGTVVYGTGWYYRPWIGTAWYGAPMTWGFGVGINWNPWTGWDVGFGWGGYRPVYRPWWGPYYGWRPRPRPASYGQPPYSGRPAPYGRSPGIQINKINVYNRPGAPRPGVRPAVRPV